ncbi:MAG TPA: tol-pal system protein YbgF [Thermoanaerobaculia bacterium]|nr:tol-pal system protein YbgF [Thermoanaerobaculia bacterium]HUM29071.1 tol-pal system protein YbgF [Thermoanaerobaculia bacterium]HXK67373.1 tol-pal system protein YbgF [Thermoanaerobaculia bacterium]
MSRALPILLLSVTFMVGCVTTEDMDRLHKEINSLHTEIINLQAQSPNRTDIDEAVARLQKEIQTLLRSNADVATDIKDLSRSIESLQTQLTDSNRRLAELSQKLALTEKRLAALPGKEESGAGENPVETGSGSVIVPPESLYQQAYQDYLQGNYELAISGFDDYLKEYPETETSDDAHFYIGECHYAMKKYSDAIKAYDRLLVRFPSSELAPAARLKKGFSFFAMGDKPQGVVEMQYVIYEYPNSEEARKAKSRLEELGIPVH